MRSEGKKTYLDVDKMNKLSEIQKADLADLKETKDLLIDSVFKLSPDLVGISNATQTVLQNNLNNPVALYKTIRFTIVNVISYIACLEDEEQKNILLDLGIKMKKLNDLSAEIIGIKSIGG